MDEGEDSEADGIVAQTMRRIEERENKAAKRGWMGGWVDGEIVKLCEDG